MEDFLGDCIGGILGHRLDFSDYYICTQLLSSSRNQISLSQTSEFDRSLCS